MAHAAGIVHRDLKPGRPQAVVTGFQDAFDPRVSADGEWILYQESPKAAGPSVPERLMRIPAAGGVPKLFLEMRNGKVSSAPATL